MTDKPPELRLWDLMRGALAARALGLVSDLRVADLLAGGPRPVGEIARETGADEDTLHRLLRALASDGVFAEDAPGVFRNTDASELLRDGGWSDFAHFFGGIWHRAAGELEPKAEAAFPRIFAADFWDWLADRPDERAGFDRAMGFGNEERIEQLAGLDWRGEETVVDIGGGNGTVLVELVRHRPGLRGVVFDLAETNRDEEAFGERIRFVAGNFFEAVPPGDVFVLSKILHDWDDERAGVILRTIRAAAPAGGRLVVLETVIQPGNEPQGAKWLDLLMLALFAGRERDEPQWRALLESTGWEPVQIEDGLIEARPAGAE